MEEGRYGGRYEVWRYEVYRCGDMKCEVCKYERWRYVGTNKEVRALDTKVHQNQRVTEYSTFLGVLLFRSL